MRATVDLPEPDSPTSAVVVPRSRSKLTFWAATRSVFEKPLPGSLKTLVRLSICMTGLLRSAALSSCTCSWAAARIAARSLAETRSDWSDGAALINRLEYGCCGRSEEHTSELHHVA